MKSLRLRYGLRTFLVILTIVAVVSAYYGNQWYRARMQTQSINAIKAAGGRMIQDNDKNATRVLFRGDDFDDAKLKEMVQHLKYLPKFVNGGRKERRWTSLRGVPKWRRAETYFVDF